MEQEYKVLDKVGPYAATLGVGSDCYPYEIVMLGDKWLEARRVRAVYDREHEDCIYYQNPNATIEIFTLRKNGRFIRKGDTITHGSRLSIGQMRLYLDPSF